uniref:Uncharacterized protein n=1 Tax=Acrobeloides nanus TaxID=290746 RepID=A0A914DAT7_9BILA
DNPLLDQILDTDEENFATSVAGVTLEEWNIYKLLDDKLKSLEGKEKPFERIKPSARKAYQRRKKEMQEKEDFVFDGSSDIEKVK